MEKLSLNIAEAISKSLNYNNDKKEVIAYGLAAIFQMISIFIITFIIGLFAGFWIESMIIFMSVGLLRKATGGAHSQTFQGCMIISIFSIFFLSFLAHYLIPIHYNISNVFIPIVLIIYGFSFYIVYKLAPVDTPAKPIVKKEKIRMLRRKSFTTLAIYFIISMTLIIFSDFYSKNVNISLSFCLSTLWQVFTLTKSGSKIINLVDRKFR